MYNQMFSQHLKLSTLLLLSTDNSSMLNERIFAECSNSNSVTALLSSQALTSVADTQDSGTDYGGEGGSLLSEYACGQKDVQKSFQFNVRTHLSVEHLITEATDDFVLSDGTRHKTVQPAEKQYGSHLSFISEESEEEDFEDDQSESDAEGHNNNSEDDAFGIQKVKYHTVSQDIFK